jgi:hypothetical protein
VPCTLGSLSLALAPALALALALPPVAQATEPVDLIDAEAGKQQPVGLEVPSVSRRACGSVLVLSKRRSFLIKKTCFLDVHRSPKQLSIVVSQSTWATPT